MEKSTLDLIKITGANGLKGAHLYLVNCNSKSTLDLMKTVGAYPSNITLDYTYKK